MNIPKKGLSNPSTNEQLAFIRSSEPKKFTDLGKLVTTI